MLKIDLHTHSVMSPDGGISQEQYMALLEDGTLDYVAITDHDRIDFAQHMHKMLGKKVIVGQEITTRDGEIIGLFLKQKVRAGLSAKATMEAIKKQKAIVYVPHPLETVRSGVKKAVLESCANLIDIIESYNGRAVMQNKGPDATTWARLNHKPVAASSDAHGLKGVGSAFTVVKEEPTPQNLVEQVNLGHLTMHRPPLHTLFYPKLNRLKQKFGRR